MTLGNTRIAAFGVCALLLSAVFAGCGGSEAPSKEDFIVQADQICADYTATADASDAEFQAAIDSDDFEGAAQLFEETTAEITSSLDEIEEIGVPEGDEETIDEWVALGREQVVIAGDIADAIRAEDGPAIEASVAEGEALQSEADAIADEYGMVDCGSAGNES